MQTPGFLARCYRLQLRAGRLLESMVFLGWLLLLLWLPLPFGSNRPWAEGLLILAVGLLLALWGLSWALSNLRLRHLGTRPLWLGLLWAAWLLWILLQTLPLDPAFIEAWAPYRWQQLQDAGQVPGVVLPLLPALSVDADLTRGQLLLSTAYALLFLLSMLLLRRRRRYKWLLWTLLFGGLVQVVYGSLMVLSGLEYGAWGAKQAYRGYATGTFVNRNHFAGYLELSLAAALGVAIASARHMGSGLDWRQRLRHYLAMLQDGPMFARVCMAFLFAGLILSQSRMGNVAAIGGLSLAGLGYLLCRPRRQAALYWLLLLGSVLLVDVLLFGRWFGLEQLAERYAAVQPAVNLRLLVLEDVRAMIPAYAPLGSGLGTFGLAYPQFRSPEVDWAFDQAHNDYLQFLIETGYPGVLLLATLVLLTVGRALLLIRRRGDALVHGVACAALAALAALGIHSAADFNLQIPANAATLVVLMAAVWSCRTRSQGRRAAPPAQAKPAAAVL
ncbi:MAG TPA: O-antigen ligase family protein [Solimonas sp.]|nr:O-antigen ligase family protein [Solimonas sp.]